MIVLDCPITLIAKIPIAECPIAKVPIAKCPIAVIPIAACPIAKCPIAKRPIAECLIAQVQGSQKTYFFKANLKLFVCRTIKESNGAKLKMESIWTATIEEVGKHLGMYVK